MALDMIVTSDWHGAQTRLTGLGPVFAISPAYRQTNGWWTDAGIEAQPLGLGGHRDGVTVEILGPADPPEGADVLAPGARFVVCRCRTWDRTGGELRRTTVDVVIGIGRV